MKEIWVLTIKTSLPETCASYDDLKMTVMAFDTYEKARTAFREKLNTLAFSVNSMFNGKGQITELIDHLRNYALSEAEIEISETEDEPKCLSKERFTQLHSALTEAFAGRDTQVGIPSGHYTDSVYLSAQVKPNYLHLYGDFEGPECGITQAIHTNIFTMAEEKDYFLYIDDYFGQDSNSSELYMDLTKVSVD